MNTLRAVSHMNFTHEVIVGDFNFPKIDWSLNWTPLSENSNEHSFTELEGTASGTNTSNLQQEAEDLMTLASLILSSRMQIQRSTTCSAKLLLERVTIR